MVETSASFDPVEASRATPAGQAKPPLASATITAHNLRQSGKPLADLEKLPMASAKQEDPHLTDKSGSLNPPEAPTEHADSSSPSLRPAPGAFNAQPTAAPWAEIGSAAFQPSNVTLQQAYDPSQDSPMQTSEAYVSAVLIAIPKPNDPGDDKTVPGKVGGVDSKYDNFPSAKADIGSAAIEYVRTLISGYTVVAAPSGGIMFTSSSVANGVQATIHGHVISAESSGIVIDGNTFALPE